MLRTQKTSLHYEEKEQNAVRSNGREGLNQQVIEGETGMDNSQNKRRSTKLK